MNAMRSSLLLAAALLVAGCGKPSSSTGAPSASASSLPEAKAPAKTPATATAAASVTASATASGAAATPGFEGPPSAETKAGKTSKIEFTDGGKKHLFQITGPAGWRTLEGTIGDDIGFEAPDGSVRVKAYVVAKDRKMADVIKLHAVHLFGDTKVTWAPEEDGRAGAASLPVKLASGQGILPVARPAKAWSVVFLADKATSYLVLAGIAESATKTRETELRDTIRSIKIE